MSSGTSPLTAFCNQLVRFFEELRDTFPEERDIRAALETIQGAKRINPRLILDVFYEHIYKDLKDVIMSENIEQIVLYAKSKINNQFNEMMPAINIFDKHWETMEEANRTAIWKYLKVLILLSEKARSVRV